MRVANASAANKPNPYYSYDSGGGGGSGSSLVEDMAGLKKNVGFLNWALGIMYVAGLSAIISSYFLLDGRIDTRFDKADAKIERLSDQASDLKFLMITEAADTRRLLEKLNPDKSDTGAKSESSK